MSTHRFKDRDELERLVSVVRQYEIEGAPLRIGVLMIPFSRQTIDLALEERRIVNIDGRLFEVLSNPILEDD